MAFVRNRCSVSFSSASLRSVQRVQISPKNHTYLPDLKYQIRPFSQSLPLSLRRSYFPYKNDNGGSPRGPEFFENLKKMINSISPNVIIWTIIGLNVGIYGIWNVGASLARSGDFSILNSLSKNFVISWQNWKEGRIWTVVTCCFSHPGHAHIIMNMMGFYFMAPAVIALLGNFSFITLYLTGGIVSSVVTLFANQALYPQPRTVTGASGAIYSVLSFVACAAPRAQFLIFFVVPVPAYACVGGIFAWDLYNAIQEKRTGVSEITHLVGILSGLAYFVSITGRFPRF
ncbi:hypothetical protein M422DRAFT_149535 [Sphaerobolus stellatus SS14]|nr:hypothetical protein M422DRAFT_149535 [Sphaerobolus stellatus SS14]